MREIAKCGVNAIVGWQFPRTTIQKYLESQHPRLLTMDFDFPSTKPCNLRCKYCFINTDKRQQKDEKRTFKGRLDAKKLRPVFVSASELGCLSAKLVGDQEPLLEEDFIPFVEYLSEKLNIWLVLFTNGTVLADNNLCKRIHGMESMSFIKRLFELRVSVMLKFHSFSNEIEDNLVGVKGYATRRNVALDRLIEAGFNKPPAFSKPEEKLAMTGLEGDTISETWTRLGLESVIMPQSIQDAEKIYSLKKKKRLYIDLDPPVPIGLTRSQKIRKKNGIHVPKEQLLDLACRIYALNKEMGIPFEGASPYFGGLPCSQLPYSLYVNAMGRIYPCCGCPDIEADGRSDYLGHISEAQALAKAIKLNPYRRHYEKYGHAYSTSPFSKKTYEGYGIFHGCPYRDRAGDLLPPKWEIVVAEYLQNIEGFTILDKIGSVKIPHKKGGQ